MTPLRLDKFIRCVKRDDGEEWFAYSIMIEGWFPVETEKVEWILSMLQDTDVRQVMEHCRANCYKDVGCDEDGVLFEK